LHQTSPYTILTKETSCDDGEPYYPVPSAKNQALYAKYKALAEGMQSKGVHFLGRLASYKYFNMDQAIAAAMEYFDAHLRPHV
jgi:UDP-galactopyranose mutase